MDVDLENICGGDIIFVENLENITIMNTLIKGGTIYFYHNISGKIEIKKSRSVASPSPNVLTEAFIGFPPEFTHDAFVIIDSCNFSCGGILAMKLGSVFLIPNNIYANGLSSCPLSSPTQGIFVQGSSGYCNITNSEIVGYNFALYAITNVKMLLHVENCSLQNNSGYEPWGSALTLNCWNP